jgi:hypothetical protein
MLPPSDLDSLLTQWENDRALLDPANFQRRMAVLDEHDLYCSGPELLDSAPRKDTFNRARLFSSQLEAANNQLFASIRYQIQTGVCPAEFSSLLSGLTTPPHGLAYDHLDDLMAGVFQFEAPTEELRPLAPDSIFYQPTPARHILHLIHAASITSADTFIDLGSGLGHVALLTSICTGAPCMGIELDPAWVSNAQKCADLLNLRNMTFLAQDAREADLSSGTVFYLYTPFTGATLADVLSSLRIQSSLRPIRICTFGPCSLSISTESWLKPLAPPAADQITVFVPRP